MGKDRRVMQPLAPGIDDALEDPDDDRLERAKFAERIFKIIDGTPVDSHIRVGIYGVWGDGKTTVLNFVKWYCRAAGHPVATFHPWRFHDRKEAWQGFVASIDQGIASWKHWPLGRFSRWNWLRRISKWARSVAHHSEVLLAKQIADLILASLEGFLEQTKTRIQANLVKILKGRRLYVFIDDLDRAQPEILYEFLMLLNEIIDFNQCIYIIALDKGRAARIIGSKLGTEDDGKDFLEKIVNWPFELPVPSDYEWRRLLNEEIKAHPDLNADALKAIFDHLSRSPRRLKHYVRYLASLHKGFLGRFDKGELDWTFLYLAQLLRFEFPEQFREMAGNAALIDDIPGSHVKDQLRAQRNRGPATMQQERAAWEPIVEDITKSLKETDRQRFTELFKALRDAGALLVEGAVRTHLLVIEVPELFTWKEYGEFKARLKSLPDEVVKEELTDFVPRGRHDKELAASREFIKMLMRERHRFLSEIADVTTESEQRELMDEVLAIMRLCDLLLDVEGLFDGENPVFDAATFKEWYGLLQHWAHFQEPAATYQAVRVKEAALAEKLARRASRLSSEILKEIRPMFRRGMVTEVDRAFQPIHTKVKGILDEALVKELVRRFKTPDGIHSLWGESSFLAEKDLLFNPGELLFHNDSIYAQLREVAEQAKHDLAIQKNFVEYARMLFYAATDIVGWARREDVVALLQGRKLLDVVWPAVTARPLNGRTVGDLEEDRKKMLQVAFGGDETVLPTPKWWKEIIGRFQERKQDRKSPAPTDEAKEFQDKPAPAVTSA